MTTEVRTCGAALIEIGKVAAKDLPPTTTVRLTVSLLLASPAPVARMAVLPSGETVSVSMPGRWGR